MNDFMAGRCFMTTGQREDRCTLNYFLDRFYLTNRSVLMALLAKHQFRSLSIFGV